MGAAVAAALVFQAGCGSSSASSTPTGPAPGPGGFANVAGTWTGTFQSSRLAARTITLTAVQGGNCVDGAWLSTPAEWSGAISGFADATSFSGQISFERTESGGRCVAIGDVSGEVGADTLQWTSSGLTLTGGKNCTDPPQALVITLRRQ